MRRRVNEASENVLETNKIFIGSVSNKSKCVSNKSIFYKSIHGESKANPNCINYNPITSMCVLF